MHQTRPSQSRVIALSLREEEWGPPPESHRPGPIYKVGTSLPTSDGRWSPDRTRTGIARLRGGSPGLVRGRGENLVGETGLAPAWASAREFLRLVCIHSTTRRKTLGAGGGNRTLMGFRPSASRTDVSTVPPRPQRMEHPRGRARCIFPRQSVAFYGLDAWSKRKDLHLRSPSGRRVYSALHLLLCHASKEMGARAGFAPATVSL